MTPRARLGVSLSVPKCSLLMQLINGQRTEAAICVDSMKSVRLLRCFDTVFRRPYRCFSIALKVFLSLSDRHKILTSDWL